MQHIETIELGSSQSSITFSSIPQDYDDLLLVHSIRSDRPTVDFLILQPNGSASNGSTVGLIGDGGSVSSFTRSDIYAGAVTNNGMTANTFANIKTYISNYSSSNNKSISTDSVNENNASFAEQLIIASLWANSAAITSLTLVSGNGSSFMAGSTASLYGITAGGDGTVTTS